MERCTKYSLHHFTVRKNRLKEIIQGLYRVALQIEHVLCTHTDRQIMTERKKERQED